MSTWRPLEGVSKGQHKLAKPNYQYEKRQRELAKKKKKEEKQAQRRTGSGSDGDQANEGGFGVPADTQEGEGAATSAEPASDQGAPA